MRVPLKISNINRERRFVDFKVAGKPEGAPRALVVQTRGKSPKKHEPPKPKAAAKAGPPAHRKPDRKTKHRRRR